MTDNNALQNAIKLMRLECNDQIRQINTGAGLKTEGFTAINRLLKRCDAVFAAADALLTLAPAPEGGDVVAWLYEKNGKQSLQFARQEYLTLPGRGWTETPLIALQSPPAPEQYAVERVARAIMAAPTRNATFATFIHEDEARSAARAILAALRTPAPAPAPVGGDVVERLALIIAQKLIPPRSGEILRMPKHERDTLSGRDGSTSLTWGFAEKCRDIACTVLAFAAMPPKAETPADTKKGKDG